MTESLDVINGQLYTASQFYIGLGLAISSSIFIGEWIFNRYRLTTGKYQCTIISGKGYCYLKC